jgi:hypothetical protein
MPRPLEAPSLPADAVAGGFALPLVAEGAPEVAESLAAMVTVTIGAGVSESGVPIQRTISPLEYVCSALKVSLSPGLPGIWTEGGKSLNWPGAILPSGPWPVNVIQRTCSSTGPSSVWTGVASFCVVTLAVHPGAGLVGDRDEARGQLHVDLDGRGVVALVRDADRCRP